MARRRLLITGAGGLVGHELVDRLADRPWRERFEGVALSRADLDVTNAAAVGAALEATRPDVIVNCAAYTRVDDAEREVEAAARLNAEAPGLLAAACAARGIGLVHLSTDYVFDGRKSTPYVEDDPVGPLSVYGRTKADGERAVASAFEGRPDGRWLIVRTQWLYGRVGPAFVKSVLARARAGEPLRVVDDQWGAPTYGRDLAEGLLALVDAGARGTVHVANAGATTWFGVARAVLEIVGLEGRVALEPVSTGAVPRPAARPAYGVLDCGRYRALTGRTLRPWREALEAFLATLP
ncbi:MAG TPA: dTDP-4-dehydrorhamnose reductase [Thermodesulfobacteriota bacterium]